MYNILLPQLVDIMLHKTYSDVRKYVAMCVQQELQKGANVKSSENDQRLVTDNLNLKEGHGIDIKSGGGSLDKQGFSDENVCLTENENIAKEVQARRTDDSGDGIGNKKYADKEVKIDKELTVCSKTADSKLDYDEKFFDKVKKVSKKRKLSGEHGLSNKLSLDLNDIQFTLRRCSQCDYVYGYKADGVKHKTMITKASNVDEGKEKCTTIVAERYVLTLVEVWKYDTGKCVDASPLLLVKSRLV
jgi:predicted nucleic-acid-binding Zn-ribbon protein